MRNILIGLIVTASCAGCGLRSHVDFAFFDLSTNRISFRVEGIPSEAAPETLLPVPDENVLSRTSSTFFEAVEIAETIKITWQERGDSRSAEFKRTDLGLSPKVRSGQIRFTYLGDGTWRVKHLSRYD